MYKLICFTLAAEKTKNKMVNKTTKLIIKVILGIISLCALCAVAAYAYIRKTTPLLLALDASATLAGDTQRNITPTGVSWFVLTPETINASGYIKWKLANPTMFQKCSKWQLDFNLKTAHLTPTVSAGENVFLRFCCKEDEITKSNAAVVAGSTATSFLNGYTIGISTRTDKTGTVVFAFGSNVIYKVPIALVVVNQHQVSLSCNTQTNEFTLKINNVSVFVIKDQYYPSRSVSVTQPCIAILAYNTKQRANDHRVGGIVLTQWPQKSF